MNDTPSDEIGEARRTTQRSSPTGPIVALVVLLLSLVVVVAAGNGTPSAPPPAPTTTAAADDGDAPPTTATKKENVAITWVGDLMIGSTTPAPPKLPPDPNTVFDPVREFLVGDIVSGNLEGPLTESGPTGKCETVQGDCFLFSQPPQFAEVYKNAGFNLLNLANNHTNDRGAEGVRNTQIALEQVGIKFAGLKNQQADFDVKGVKVRVIGFARNESANSITDLTQVAETVKVASQGVDLVYVVFHGGEEGEAAAKSVEKEIVDFAHTAVDNGADMVVGSGPHVLRAMEVYNGRLIAYSLGNFATYERFNVSGIQARSAVLQATVAPDGTFVTGKLVPVRLEQQGDKKGLPQPGGQAIPFMQELNTKFGPTGVKVADDGTLSAPDAAAAPATSASTTTKAPTTD